MNLCKFWKLTANINKKLEVNDKGAQDLISVAPRGVEQFPAAAARGRSVEN